MDFTNNLLFPIMPHPVHWRTYFYGGQWFRYVRYLVMFEIHFPAIKKKSRKPFQGVIVTGDSCKPPSPFTWRQDFGVHWKDCVIKRVIPIFYIRFLLGLSPVSKTIVCTGPTFEKAFQLSLSSKCKGSLCQALLGRSRCWWLFSFFLLSSFWGTGLTLAREKTLPWVNWWWTRGYRLITDLNTVQEAQTHPGNTILLGADPRWCFLPSVKLYRLWAGFIFLISLCSRSQLGCWYRLVHLSPFFTCCGQRLKNHSGISWNGIPDIICQLFWAATDYLVLVVIWLQSRGR